ncbi:hypothetical protein Q8F55_008598 [Vanrija albida]|uniref:Nuclear pore complex protein NUP96 C-terminal domain-containing protein n=1 Tax=Vanrija albida TaxID=181172 RepID=A0ABR3PR98_9TREE
MAHENQTVEPTAGPSTPPVVGTIAASLEQLSIGRLRGPVRTLAMFEVAPPARYNLDASPARTSTTNRFWVAAPADDTKLTPPTEPNPPPDPSPKGKARARPAPPLAVLAAAEFAELRVALQRAQLPGAAGDVAAGIADLGCFLDGGRQRARFVGVRVPPCVAADGPVVLGRAVARIPGPLEQFAVFCLVLPPPSRRRMPVPSASSIAKVAKWVRDDASSSLSHVFLHLAMAHGVSVRPLGPPPSAHAMALLAGLEALRGDWDDAVEKLVLYEYFASGREADINDNFRLAERTNIKGLSPDLIRVESPSSKQLCRVLGYLERLRTSDSPLDPPQDALHILQDTLAACVPSAKVEEGERKAWLDWVATTKIKQLIIGWAFADGADGAHWVLVWDVGGDLRSAVWRVLDDSAQKLTDAFVHIALGVAGLCTRVAWARDESQC